jgi:hypothetical protein
VHQNNEKSGGKDDLWSELCLQIGIMISEASISHPNNERLEPNQARMKMFRRWPRIKQNSLLSFAI